jgi:hypothetical protein
MDQPRNVSMAKSKKQAQALAIKLSRQRRAGEKIPAPPKGRYSEQTRRRAQRDLARGRAKGGATKRRSAKKKR